MVEGRTGAAIVAFRSASPAGPLARLERQDGAAAALLALVAARRGISVAELMDRRRCRAEVALARQLAMYLTHVVLSRSLTRVGILFGRDRTTVAHACALIEDRRERADFDAEVEELERAIGRLLDPVAEAGEAAEAGEVKHARS